MKLEEIIKGIVTEEIKGDLEKEISGIHIDSRLIEPGHLFVALKGTQTDGHAYIDKAIEKGAVAIVCETLPCSMTDGVTYIKVESTEDIVGKMATTFYGDPTSKFELVGVTGTNGKTTTKELTAAVLSKKYNIIYTQGNYNNHIGVPLTLLQMRPDTEMAVVEMGANHINEIAQLCSIAQPDFGLITNIGKAHIEGFGSFEGVVKTKNELYEHIRNNGGKIFVNNDNTLLRELSKDLTCFSYGKDNNADIKAEVVSFNPYLTIRWNDNEIKTNLIGEYNFENVLAAISIGTYFNVDKTQIIKAIEDYYPTNNRSQYIKTDKNEIVMDAYNANPVSMSNAIRNFRRISSNNALLILGDMKELGKDSENEHSIIISLVKELGFNKVFLVGEELLKADIDKSFSHFSDVDELISYINTHEVKNHKILVKGSNSIHLEKLKNIL